MSREVKHVRIIREVTIQPLQIVDGPVRLANRPCTPFAIKSYDALEPLIVETRVILFKKWQCLFTVSAPCQANPQIVMSGSQRGLQFQGLAERSNGVLGPSGRVVGYAQVGLKLGNRGSHGCEFS